MKNDIAIRLMPAIARALACILSCESPVAEQHPLSDSGALYSPTDLIDELFYVTVRLMCDALSEQVLPLDPVI